VYFVARHYRTDIGLAEVKRLGLTTHVVVVPPPPRRSANAEAYEAGDNPGPAGGLEGQVPTGKRKRRRRKRNRGGSNNEPAGAAQGDA
jgi:hypothetical protein